MINLKEVLKGMEERLPELKEKMPKVDVEIIVSTEAFLQYCRSEGIFKNSAEKRLDISKRRKDGFICRIGSFKLVLIESESLIYPDEWDDWTYEEDREMEWEEDFYENALMNCGQGMGYDGCMKAGSEECDWECPFSGELYEEE